MKLLSFRICFLYYFLLSGHNASKACNKCNKYFPGGFGNKNFGGFNRSNWEPRTDEEPRRQIREFLSQARSLNVKGLRRIMRQNTQFWKNCHIMTSLQ